MFKVGCAGIPSSTPKGGTINGIIRAKQLGFSCQEIEFVHSIYLNDKSAADVGKTAQENNITLTLHCPYYININSKDSEKREASKQRIIKSAKLGAIMGAKSVTFHPASLQKTPPEVVYKIVKEELKEVIKASPKSISIAPETAGKVGNFGSWKEIIDLAKELECGACIDFSHVWARTQGKADFEEVIDYYVKNLGKSNMHIHMSGIEFTKQGEKHHLPITHSDFPYKKILKLLVEKGCSGVIICEDPDPEKGAREIQRVLKELQC